MAMIGGAARIAVIADVHGNSDALSAVLARIEADSADAILNLGDHFSGPLAAGETAAILRDRPDIISIRGNHDRWLVEQAPEDMGASDSAAFDQLTQADLNWLRSLPPTIRESDVLACHATPGDDLTYWLETVTPDGTVAMRPQEEIETLAGSNIAPLMLCAHTHIPRAVRLASGALIVNPGSVGCPAYDDDHPVPHQVETGLPDARYAILDRHGADWSVTFRTVPYDTARMARLAKEANRPEWAGAVATGRVTAP